MSKIKRPEFFRMKAAYPQGTPEKVFNRNIGAPINC